MQCPIPSESYRRLLVRVQFSYAKLPVFDLYLPSKAFVATALVNIFAVSVIRSRLQQFCQLIQFVHFRSPYQKAP